MSDTTVHGGYTENEIEQYLISAQRLNAVKKDLGERLSLLAAFGKHHLGRRTFNLGGFHFARDHGVYTLGVEERRGMKAPKIIVWGANGDATAPVCELVIGKDGKYPIQTIPTWLVVPMREAVPKIFDVIDATYPELRVFLEDLKRYAR